MSLTLHLRQGRGKSAPQVQWCVVLRAVFFSLLVALSCLDAFLWFVNTFCGLLTTKGKLNNWLYWYFFLRATCILKIRRKCKNLSVSLILYACVMIMNVRAMCTAFFSLFLTSKYWHLIKTMSQTKGFLFDGSSLIKTLYRYWAKPIDMTENFCGLNAFRSSPK